MEDLNGKKISFGCCFCDTEIEDPDNEAQVCVFFLSPHVNEHLEQYWWAHMQCFEESLHAKYREMREEWHEVMAEKQDDADL